MADYVHSLGDDNDTMAALRRYFTDKPSQRASEVLPYSVRKYGGVSFDEGGVYSRCTRNYPRR